MKDIAFIDLEVEPKSKKILDIGSVKASGASFRKSSVTGLLQFVKGTEFVCGHNILYHDLNYVGKDLEEAGIRPENVIDTLFLSPLLFPTKPYHSLVKDDKLQTEEMNNPLNDAIKAKDLLNDEVAAFAQLDEPLRRVFHGLLKDQREFQAFFRYLSYRPPSVPVEHLIGELFATHICAHVDIAAIRSRNPIELAYSLSLIDSLVRHREIHSITPPWVLKNYPGVERVLFRLRSKRCIQGCAYCSAFLDAHKGLKRFFGFDSYRSYGGEPLQEKAVEAAIDNKSILAVFPTGGGKSITFQVPALMAGETAKALTVVISPLQSLMKDQVDNLEKIGMTDAVTINGLLDPIERAKSFERVKDGSASLLYISPESLRSKTIERLILGRKIARFVIDEAHCFSAWGQDFRVDYLYIADFIKMIQEKKHLLEAIPVSCFTATAKQKVIEDIRRYFQERLSLDLDLYTSKASRTNLQYQVLPKQGEVEKYQAIRDLIEKKPCPTIIYVSRTGNAEKLAKRLKEDGFLARAYHGKMAVKEKTENQNAFIAGEVPIMVATSAFGMGVDKKDVGMVIHYEISDSLENYVQEAGRAGRDEDIVADCYVLFHEEDLAKHFILLNQTKLSIKEIQQIWRAIKELTKVRSRISNSALEIAREAGWDDQVMEMGTRVTTALAALEDAGYLKRGQNMPRVFANSILSKTAQEAINKINASPRFDEARKAKAVRIIKKLFSSKSLKYSSEESAESRIDYISDHLGIGKGEVIHIVNLLREEKILADTKDLTAFIKKGENKNRSLAILEAFGKIEQFLLPFLEEQELTFHRKELNERAEEKGLEASTSRIKTIINFWVIKNWVKRKNLDSNHFAAALLRPREQLQEKLEKRLALAAFIVAFLYDKSNRTATEEDHFQTEALVEFSVHELKAAFDGRSLLFREEASVDEVEDALYYLSRIGAIKIEGGFLVLYNSLTLERTEQNNKKQYTKDDYRKLHQFYESKVQQIHIVGEYAKKMIEDYKSALQFVEDYFQLNYTSFLNKYFKGHRQDEIRKNITPAKFRQLFVGLSARQLAIINDSQAKRIVVAAGPGSGKTKVLVHKLASLLLMEDVKHEQLLMVTFSRAAATEFKKRLLKLIGNAANFVEIKTFHSYCFDLLGKVGSVEKSGNIIQTAIEKIRSGEVERSRITKTVLVIDEAQDMDATEFGLVTALMERNEEMRVIAVGDDDQNIYEFRGASAQYLEAFIREKNAVKHELIDNFRSKKNLVHFTNQFVGGISRRLKHMPIVATKNDDGRIRIVRHENKNLINPLVGDVLATGLSGTTCILTQTNDEALQVAGLLVKQGMQAKLIQSNDGFSLYNLAEVRFFLDHLNLAQGVCAIHDDIWLQAKRAVVNKYRDSPMLDVLGNIVKEFEASSPNKRYRTDLEMFVRESKLEDFYTGNSETVFVSTIHKAKGREFDNVFLLLEDFAPSTDQAKRLLYVAMTRAKNNLTIHLNASFLDGLQADHLERIENAEIHRPPSELVLHLSYIDVWLDYFIGRQHTISHLMSGDELVLFDGGCADGKGNSVLKFSKHFRAKMTDIQAKGYEVTAAKVNFVLFWKKEASAPETKVILPELVFERK